MKMYQIKSLLSSIFLSLLLCGVFRLNAQTLKFASLASQYNRIEWVDKALTADLNGDGFPDFIVSWELQRKLYVGLGEGRSFIPDFMLIDDESQLIGLTVVDLDMDGDLDIVGAAPFEKSSYWWKNDGAANFTKMTLTNIEDYKGIHFADLDGDNQLEAIISIDDGLHIYTNDAGELTFQSTLFEDFFGDDAPAIQTFDNNRDGLLDIAATFNRNGIILYQQVANLGYERINVAENLFNQSSLFITDINQDGGIDFVSSSTFNGTASIITNNNDDGTYTITDLPKDFGRNEFTTIGDIESDGDDDILYYEEKNSSTSSLSLLINNGIGEFTNQPLWSNASSSNNTVTIVDLDNNGFKEIVVFSNLNGFYIVFYDTAAFSTSTFEEKYPSLNIFPSLLTSSFKIELAGKFDYVIVDISGKEITKGVGREQAIVNCHDWNKGTYFITVNQNGILTTNQLIKAD